MSYFRHPINSRTRQHAANHPHVTGNVDHPLSKPEKHSEGPERNTGSDSKSRQSAYEITKVVKSQQDQIEQCDAAKSGVLPEHPFRMYIVGASGSGKSNFMLNLLTRDEFYKDYFDSILIISPTAANLDDTYRVLKLEDEHFYPVEEEVLTTIMEIQESRIEEMGGKQHAPKTLVIMDDIVSYKKFTNSPMLLKFAVMSRHWGISLFILSQAYHRIPKSVRIQMTALVYFKGSNRELEVLYEDFAAPGASKKEFINTVAMATNKRYNFFFVDVNRPHENRYRQNLTIPLFQNENTQSPEFKINAQTDQSRFDGDSKGPDEEVHSRPQWRSGKRRRF